MRIKKEKFDESDARYSLIDNKKTVGVVNMCGGFIEDLEIDKDYRRKGYATMLMKEVLRDFEHEELTLLADDCETPIKILKGFYRQLGFKSDKIHHNFMVRRVQKVHKAN
jgi:ribosomal protein S18 acetylase RimI-like enzyme